MDSQALRDHLDSLHDHHPVVDCELCEMQALNNFRADAAEKVELLLREQARINALILTIRSAADSLIRSPNPILLDPNQTYYIPIDSGYFPHEGEPVMLVSELSIDGELKKVKQKAYYLEDAFYSWATDDLITMKIICWGKIYGRYAASSGGSKGRGRGRKLSPKPSSSSPGPLGYKRF